MKNIITEFKDYDCVKIIVENLTGVMYIAAEGRGAHGGGVAITPMLNKDGTPRVCRFSREVTPIIAKVAVYDYYTIWEDTLTGVMYIVAEGRGAHGGGVAITPMLNEKGLPRTENI